MTNSPAEFKYPLRLQKFLARAGVASRRGSENLMTAGRVSVNGAVITELGSKVNPQTDVVCVDGKRVEVSGTSTTIMLNKPAGYITTMSDPHGRKTVASLVPTHNFPGLFPIGRLDAQTTGLLLFSTDGNLGNALLHPAHHVEKTYIATVEGCPSEAAIEKLQQGIMLEDGITAPAKVSIHSKKGNTAVVRLVLHEGRKRQVRRMMAAVGNPVLKLNRTSFGPVSLGNLARGKWRKLNEAELEQIYACVK